MPTPHVSTPSSPQRLPLLTSLLLLVGAVVMAGAWVLTRPALPPTLGVGPWVPDGRHLDAPVLIARGPGGEALVRQAVEIGASFTSPASYLGLYDSDGDLVDEVRVGYGPLTLRAWDRGGIVLAPGDATAEMRFRDEPVLGGFRVTVAP